MATDPVCGMYVDERSSTLSLFRDNRTYYFCATSCRDAFAAPGAKLARLRRELLVAWPLAIIAAVATYVTLPYGGYVAAGAATVVQVYAGRSFYRGTYDALRSQMGNMDVLIAVATTAAYLYSLAALLGAPGLPRALYFDASSLILTLILSGNYLEHLTRVRATGALRRLSEMLPATAHRWDGTSETTVPLAEVGVGDRLRVRPGERFPVDATVADGRSTANESILTGESLPVAKAPGDRVLAGAVNGEGLLVVVAAAVGEETFLAQVGQLLSEAEMSRVPLQRLANRIAAAFVPTILLLAGVAGLGWGIATVGGFPLGLLVFVSVAITACPCAFGIATPAAIVVGTGRAAESGVLFRGEDALSRAASATIVLTDKTGTLTLGAPSVVDVLTRDGWDRPTVTRLAAALEQGSEHPLARAVVAAAPGSGALPIASGTTAEPGRGVHGVVEGRAVRVISGAAATEEALDLEPFRAGIAAAASRGGTCSVVVVDGVAVALLEFADTLRPSSAAAVAALHAMGIETVMVTGDAPAAARAVAAALGIRTVHAGVSPAGKLALVRSYREQGRAVAFVGDGVNDAPALAAADVGIAIGTGSDVAKEAGQVLLVRPDFLGVPRALALARTTVRKVRGNLLWAIGYNAVLVPVAAGALVPLFGLGVYAVLPITGAVAMALSSTTVVLNSLSLRWSRLPGLAA